MSYSKNNEAFRRKGSPMASGLVYQHMSSHYRRILNAKPAVDTSAPQTFKPRPSRVTKPPLRHYNSSLSLESRSVCSSQDSYYVVPSDEQLIDKIVASEKFSPSVVCGMEWTSSRRNHLISEKKIKPKLGKANNEFGCGRQLSRSANQRPRVPIDILDRHEEQFEALGNQFWPRILKTEAESKLRHMRVYHPPKRKAFSSKNEWTSNKEESADDGRCKCHGVCACSQVGDQRDCKEQSQTSSRDSAYNGGTSSTADSRSPTPSQQKQRISSGDYIDENSVRCISHTATQTDPVESSRSSNQIALSRRGSNDAAYTKLIHDITEEVIEKGQCTDKSLARIISRHITDNINNLEKGRMLMEVSKLKKQLGISEKGDDFENFLTEDDDLSQSSLFHYNATEKHYEYKKDSLESESWTSTYSHLSNCKDNAREKVEVTENSLGYQKLNLNATFDIGKTIRKGTPTESGLRLRRPKDDEEESESDSSKQLTIKEVIASQIKDNDSESEEISYEIEQIENSSDEA